MGVDLLTVQGTRLTANGINDETRMVFRDFLRGIAQDLALTVDHRSYEDRNDNISIAVGIRLKDFLDYAYEDTADCYDIPKPLSTDISDRIDKAVNLIREKFSELGIAAPKIESGIIFHCF